MAHPERWSTGLRQRCLLGARPSSPESDHSQRTAVVDRVIVEGRKAQGVVLADGALIEAGLVIVSAGAIHSPAILLRSGIDRPGIGMGLKDHPSVTLTLGLNEPCRSRSRHCGAAALVIIFWDRGLAGTPAEPRGVGR